MADFTQIIQEINEDITTNGVGAITGAKLNEVLRDMIAAVNAAKTDILADGSVFGGFVNASDPIPHGNDNRYYYIATQQGTYTNFGGFVLDGNFAVIFYWDEGQGSWGMSNLYITENGLANELQSYVNNQDFYTDMGFLGFDYFRTYNQGDFVVYHGVLYQFNAQHSGAWTGNDVDETDLFTIMENGFSDVFSAIGEVGNNKADKVSGAINGHLAGLDSIGDLTDSGKSVSDFATAAQGTKADTAFQKPSGGIPASDLSTAVQTSLGKADTAVQTESDPVFSASPAADITSGDIADWDGKADPIPVVDASTIPASMDADKVYKYGTLSGNTTFPALNAPTDLTVAHVYFWTFTTPATEPTITWPNAITSWAGGSAPTINASKSYEVSVMDGLATIIEA